jgi:hypothetical protein
LTPLVDFAMPAPSITTIIVPAINASNARATGHTCAAAPATALADSSALNAQHQSGL